MTVRKHCKKISKAIYEKWYAHKFHMRHTSFVWWLCSHHVTTRKISISYILKRKTEMKSQNQCLCWGWKECFWPLWGNWVHLKKYTRNFPSKWFIVNTRIRTFNFFSIYFSHQLSSQTLHKIFHLNSNLWFIWKNFPRAWTFTSSWTHKAALH